MKILFFKFGSIGDTLMTTPLVRQVRKNFPDAGIDYLIGNWSAGVLKKNKNLNQVIRFDEDIFIKKQVFRWLQLIKKIKKRGYDIVFVLDKHWSFNLTAFLFGIKKRIGFDRLGRAGVFLTNKVIYDSDRHELFYYLDLAAAIGLKVDYDDFGMDLPINNADITYASRVFKKIRGKNIVGIAPGGCYNPRAGYDKSRQWPIEKYVKLTNKLLAKDISVILIGGKNDRYANQGFNKIKNKNLKNLIGKTTISQAASLIRRCNCFVCNDSGLMHIATCVNKNIISIFGPTHPQKKAPLWKQSTYVWNLDDYSLKNELKGKQTNDDSIKKIQVKDVLKKIKIKNG